MNRTTSSVYLAVFISGFAFLSYEINLFRILATLYGTTMVASTIVLSTFMAGYGLGAYHFGLRSGNKNSYRMMPVLIALMGVSGLVAYVFIAGWVSNLYIENQWGGLWFYLRNGFAYFLSGIFLILPAYFMGGILPVASQILQGQNSELKNSISTLYALDTFGGVIGALATSFLLNKYLGQIQTVIIVSLLLAFCFIIVFISSEWENSSNPLPIDNRGRSVLLNSKNHSLPLLLTALGIGFVMNGFQILMIRIFKVYLINTLYAFSLTTAIVILGLFVGSYWFKRQIKPVSLELLISRLLVMGALVLLVALIANKIPALFMFPFSNLISSEIFRAFGVPSIILIFTVLPVAIFSGYLFPTIVTLLESKEQAHGQLVGKALMFNTVGSVTGPIITAFLLLPMWGIVRSLYFIGIIPLITTWILSIRMQSSKGITYLRRFAAALAISAMVYALSVKDYRILPPSFLRNNTNVLVYSETLEGNYVVGEEQQRGNRVLSTYVNNSAVIGTTYDAIKVVKMVGHLPFLLGLHCKNALVVGFGIGVTTAAIAVHQEVKQIDCVELVKDLTKVAHFYTEINNNIHIDPRLRFFQDDGRHFLQRTNKKFDLISSDPTHPILGSGGLYTKEYWELCKKRLTDSGMVSQYLPLHKLTSNDFLGIIKTFQSVFNHSAVFLGHYHAVLIGSMNPLSIDFSQWEQNMNKTASDKLFYNNPYHQAAMLVLDAEGIEKITQNRKINTDNLTYTDYFNFSALSENNIWQNLALLNTNRTSVFNFFKNIPDSTLMQRFVKGNFYLTEGLAEMLKGNRKGLFLFLEKAVMVNPENVEYPLLITFYSQWSPK